MRWQIGCRSTNVEARCGMKISAPVVGGGVGETLISLLVLLLGRHPSGLWQQYSLPTK
jgi:hypothetical protein